MFFQFTKNLILVSLLTFYASNLYAENFDIVTSQAKVTLVYTPDGDKLDSIAANLLAADIQRITGYLPRVVNNITLASGNVIIMGSLKSKMMQDLHSPASFDALQGKWECYSFKLLKHPFKGINKALVITGSDTRGTAYGVFELAKRLGVSPWYWWADVLPEKKKLLSLNIENFSSSAPSVKYRGIFINDEDWGLLPWSAKTFDPATANIGPKTYAKVFELLLRLKANLIWPAMHPGTKAFYQFTANKKVAADYQIIVGSSHAEPMLRNNVSEWDKDKMGDFNYLSNQKKVFSYWEDRVKESHNYPSMYSLGMRGIHDSGLEGIKNPADAVPLLQQIFSDQRGLLRKYADTNITHVPQAFTAYKEVLDIYDHGLQLPDDVTLVWPDDNYGYIQRLNTTSENKRKGGSGIYYHASYWGRPHDYLWLSTTPPALIREELTKAYENNARDIWVLNVGDIKPAEYHIQLFMDMAYHIDPFQDSKYSKTHLLNWLQPIFGISLAPAIKDILWKNYQLAFERKPEFMGWSQTEPTTKINFTAYNHMDYGDQAQRRIDAYSSLETAAKALRYKISPLRKDAFYELVYYPVVASSLMNKKFLYRDKAFLYIKEGRIIGKNYETLSKKAFQEITVETAYYNQQLANGKWAHLMSMIPRNLPVFHLPEFNFSKIEQDQDWKIKAEGNKLPAFSKWNRQKHFVDIFLSKETAIDYTVKASKDWIKVSQLKGKLTADGDNSQDRIWVEIDWDKLPLNQYSGELTFEASNRSVTVPVWIENLQQSELKNFNGFVENNGLISIYASHYTKINNAGKNYWKLVNDLGPAGTAMETVIQNTDHKSIDTVNYKNNASMEYNFYTLKADTAEIKIYTLPTHPLNKNFGMRYAVSVDNGPVTVLNYKTIGRTEEWKQNVLSNAALRSVKIPVLNKGKHVLKIYLIDPYVILDRIVIGMGALKPYYGLLPESQLIKSVR